MNAGMSGRALRQIKRWFGKRSSESVLILVYHRVAKARSDPWSLSEPPEHFAEHLEEALRQHAVPLRLQQLSRALAKGTLPNRSLAVTFDAGYADDLYDAKPLDRR